MKKNKQPQLVLRRCVSCRSTFNRVDMLSVNYNKENQQIRAGKQLYGLGRTAYVCRKAPCLQAAIKGRKIPKALKCPVPDDIVNVLNIELEGLKTSGNPESQSP